MKVVIKRVTQNDQGTFGVLLVHGVPIGLTMEPPWNDNAIDISCIPAGEYWCKRVDSPQFGNTFEITDVPGRTHILFHKGNWTHNTKGCVVVGEEFDKQANGEVMLRESRHAYEEFHTELANEVGFWVSIRHRI